MVLILRVGMIDDSDLLDVMLHDWVDGVVHHKEMHSLHIQSFKSSVLLELYDC